MDIDRVRYFHVFAETGSLVKAAEILHISQPALSKALKVLEEEVGQKLLASDGRGLKLTQTGEVFRKQTSDLLEKWLQIPSSLNSTATTKHLKIGSFEVFTTYFLKHLDSYLSLDAFDLYELTPGLLEQAIVDHLIDVGITYLPIPKQNLEFVEVGKIRMGTYGVKTFVNEDVNTLPFVVPIAPLTGAPSKVAGLDGWPDHKVTRTIKYRVTLMESALQLCRIGKAVAYLPDFVVALHNQAVTNEYKLVEMKVPIKEKERKQSVYIVYRKDENESSLIRQFAKALRNLS